MVIVLTIARTLSTLMPRLIVKMILSKFLIDLICYKANAICASMNPLKKSLNDFVDWAALGPRAAFFVRLFLRKSLCNSLAFCIFVLYFKHIQRC